MSDWSSHPGQHPDLEALSAFVDGTLTVPERAEVEAHLALCDDCFEIVTEVMATGVAAEIPHAPVARTGLSGLAPTVEPLKVVQVTPPRRMPWVLAGLALAAMLLLAVWLPRQMAPDEPSADPRLEKLVAAIGDERFIDARLTGGFVYGPLRAPVRSGSTSANLSVLAAAGELQKAAQADPSARALHAYGVARLLIGEITDGIATLRDASALAPRDARIRADLAAALLARARQLDRPEDLPAALSEADAAIELDGTLAEAWFNRAVALEQLSLFDQARDAWGEYLKRDPSGEWADEARARLSKLQQSSAPPLPADHPQTLRAALERELFPEAAPGLREAVARYQSATGDALFSDAVATFAPHDDLRAAHASYRDALIALEADQLADAVALLQSAHQTFERRGSAFAWWCLYHLAATDYLARRYDDALTRLSAVLDESARRQYHSLRAHALWTRAVIAAARGDFAGALPYLADALQLAEQTGEVHLSGRLLNQMADLQQYLGYSHEAWQSRVAALAIAARVQDRRVRNSVYGSTATVLMREGRTAAARVLLEAQVAANTAAAPVVTRLTLSSRQAMLALADGELARAAEFARESEAWLAQAAGDVRHDSLSNTVDVTRARIAAESGDHATAIALATRAVDRIVEGRNAQIRDALLVRARAYAAQGDAERATDDVLQVLRLVDQRRPGQAGLFTAPDVEGLRQLANDLLSRHASVLAPVHTVRLAQTARALSSPLRPRDPQLLVPRVDRLNTAIVVYTVAAEQTLVGVITSHGVELVAVPRSQSDLLAAARGLSWSIRARAAERTRDQLATLYSDLARPVIERLPASVDRLIIVPDWPLDSLPFAAFADARSGRFLVEDYAIQFAPHLWATTSTRRHAAPVHAVVVADPESADATARGLRRLHGAREEARLIAPLYRTTSLLAGADATVSRLSSEVAAADVLHIAAHVLVDGVDGAHSRLLLAGNQADASLFSRDIERLPLEHTRTVILAGCGTAAADHRPHAPTAMATQFLASGPEEVAGMLWDLDDAVAAAFFARVHEGVAAGWTLRDAVRQAQLQQIDEDRRQGTQHSLPTWANVVVYGLIPLSRSDDATSG